MAEKFAKLERENIKLKEEIQGLQRALRDISRDRSIPSSPVNTLIPQYQHKSFSNHSNQLSSLSHGDSIDQKLEKGIFSPPKRSRDLPKSNLNRHKEKSLNLVISKESTQPIKFVPRFGEINETMSPLARNTILDTRDPKQFASLNEGGISRASVQEPDVDYSGPKESSFKQNSKRTLNDEIQELKLSMARINAALEQKENVFLNQAKKDTSCSFVKNTFEYEKENSSPSSKIRSLDDSFGSLYEDTKADNQKSHYKPILRHESPKTQEYPIHHDMSETFDSYINNESREQSLIQEIDALKEENKILRDKSLILTSNRPRRGRKRTASRKSIHKSPNHISNSILKSPNRSSNSILKSPNRSSKSILKSPNRISKSPGVRSKSIRKKSRSITPNRYRHCSRCDQLLYKGYSTKYCSKHKC